MELSDRAKQEKRVLSLLQSSDRKFSVVDLCTILQIADPRSVICHLRRKGFTILDEWRKSDTGARYKVYFTL